LRTRIQAHALRCETAPVPIPELLSKLRAKNKLQEVTDAATVVRKMKLGRTDATIVAAPILVSAAIENQLSDVLRGTVIPSLPVTDSGLYLSTKRLDAQNLPTLLSVFQNKVHLAHFWLLFKAPPLGPGPAWRTFRSSGSPGWVMAHRCAYRKSMARLLAWTVLVGEGQLKTRSAMARIDPKRAYLYEH
jgi:hypothetical protein